MWIIETCIKMYKYYKLYYSVYILKCWLFFCTLVWNLYKFKIVILSYIIVIQMVRVMVELHGEHEKTIVYHSLKLSRLQYIWLQKNVVNSKTMTFNVIEKLSRLHNRWLEKKMSSITKQWHFYKKKLSRKTYSWQLIHVTIIEFVTII